MNSIPKQLFDLLAGYVRHPRMVLTINELEWYESGNERLLGLLAMDKTDHDFAYVILGRDKLKRFRAILWEHSLPSKKQAREKLKRELATMEKKPSRTFFQGDEKGEPLDPFKPIVDNDQLNPAFVHLSTRGTQPANKVIEEMLNWYNDVDGNFLEQLQTTGFDARIWELYLYALFIERGFVLDRTYQAPDYLCVTPWGSFFVEATTVNPSQPPVDLSRLTRAEYYEHYVPLKFGSALFSKLKKRYWEQEHVKGNPLILAIQDFHEWQSMSWSIYGLAEYVYGVRGLLNFRSDNTSTIAALDEFKVGNKTVPAGFFSQPDAENISAVIANPGGTIAKFDRIGFQAGFGAPNIRIVQFGLAFEDAKGPVPFVRNPKRGEDFETWEEGLTVFHNPNALHPLEPETFPSAAHYFVRENDVIAQMPAFHPIGSGTWLLDVRENFDEAGVPLKNLIERINPSFKPETT